MTELTEEQWRNAEQKAALCFKELVPEYIVCPENWQLMLAELRKREEASCDVKSYLGAFTACRNKLKLRNPEEIEPVEKLLTEADLEKMPAEEFRRRVVIPEFLELQRRNTQ
jgi:hypothetical protein